MPQKLSYNEVKNYIESKGFLLKSEDYINYSSKLEIICHNNHVWYVSLCNFKKTNCPFCVGRKKYTINHAIEEANKRGGKLLSTTFKSSNEKLAWKCKNDHIFTMTLQQVIHNKGWCPNCSIKWKSEEFCRYFFEKIFNNHFPKSNPSWLRNSKNRQLHLDGYCKKLGIAFEHNGMQHYKYISFFRNKQTLNTSQQNDKEKIELCKKNNVKLIIIPQLFTHLKLNDLSNFIYKELDNYNIIYSKKNIEINFYDIINKDIYNKKTLIKANEIAEKHNGKCLSTQFLHSKIKLQWQCAYGHTWFAEFSNIKNGNRWCKQCYYNSKIKNIQDIISKDVLLELYIKKQKPLIEIAKKYNTSKIKIRKLLDFYNIQLNKKRMYKYISYEQLYDLCIIHKYSQRKISKILNVDHKTISRKLKHFNLLEIT